ncbi:MAG: hypothetical protein AAF127_00065 [Pseudomonadota bacterium]
MGATPNLSAGNLKPFDANWALMTEHANELFAAKCYEEACAPYERALDEAKAQFEVALVSGGHAQDVVPMVIVSVSNAALNHAECERPERAFALLEKAALTFANALGSSTTPPRMKQAIISHLPRLMMELDRPKLAAVGHKKRNLALQERLKGASLKVLHQTQELRGDI